MAARGGGEETAAGDRGAEGGQVLVQAVAPAPGSRLPARPRFSVSWPPPAPPPTLPVPARSWKPGAAVKRSAAVAAGAAAGRSARAGRRARGDCPGGGASRRGGAGARARARSRSARPAGPETPEPPGRGNPAGPGRGPEASCVPSAVPARAREPWRPSGMGDAEAGCGAQPLLWGTPRPRRAAPSGREPHPLLPERARC